MNISNIINYIQVSERIASSGQPTREQFESIADEKYQVVINLISLPHFDSVILEEGHIVTALEMTYVHIPVPFNAPKAEHLRQFIKIMDAFSDQKIWVHCVANYRVSAFLYQYSQLVYGATPEEAKKVMLPSWIPNEVWQNFMAISPEEIRL